MPLSKPNGPWPRVTVVLTSLCGAPATPFLPTVCSPLGAEAKATDSHTGYISVAFEFVGFTEYMNAKKEKQDSTY
jgi:hypothetical protein